MRIKKKKKKEKILTDQCLLLKTPDNRYFFTYEKNYPMLIEFGKTFNAEISIVKTAEQVQVLDLEELAESICTEATDCIIPNYKIIEKRLTPKNSSKVESKDIKAYIQAEMLKGNTVTIDNLHNKYEYMDRKSLSYYFARARHDLAAKGHQVKRDQAGKYRIKKT